MSFQEKYPSEWNHNSAQWRASANEGMPYTEDFPECLLTLAELYDGAISQGKSTVIRTRIYLPKKNAPGKMAKLTVEDNGEGIASDESLARLLSWASTDSTSLHHRYGHGSKKMLTKWMHEYETAKWSLHYRAKSRRGPTHTNDLIEISAPFLGTKTPKQPTNDDTVLNPSGLCWTIHFDPEILTSVYRSPDMLYAGIKEIICSRYSRMYLAATRFELAVLEDDTVKYQGDSSTWQTFEEALEAEVKLGNARISRGKRVQAIQGGRWEATEYMLTFTGDKGTDLVRHFPTYGHKSMKSSRVHISIDGRYIEALPIYKVMGIDTNHNRFNGRIVIVNFVPNLAHDYEMLPTPSTTKVSFYENCKIFQAFKKNCSQFLLEEENPLPESPVYIKELTMETIHSLKLDELKLWCNKFSLSSSGTKSTIVDRLKGHLTPKAKAVVAPTLPNIVYDGESYAEFVAKYMPAFKSVYPAWKQSERMVEIASYWNKVKPPVAKKPKEKKQLQSKAKPEPVNTIIHALKEKEEMQGQGQESKSDETQVEPVSELPEAVAHEPEAEAKVQTIQITINGFNRTYDLPPNKTFDDLQSYIEKFFVPT